MMLLTLGIGGEMAAATDNGSGPSRDDLKNVCIAQKGVCKSVCPADDGSFNGGLITDLCLRDCDEKYLDCIVSLPAKQRNYQVTKRRGNADEVVAPQ